MKLKICGVQSVEEAQKLAEMGVDFIGLNFVPASLRRIDLQTGRHIAASLKALPVKTVALFQDQSLDLVREHIKEIKPDYAQLHGRETAEYIAELDKPVIRAITTDELPPNNAAYYLLDRPKRGQGPVIAANVAADIIGAYPDRIFLAGGLTPENLLDILEQLKPFGVDIAGGVRTDGEIDLEKVKKVLEIVRSQP